MRLADKKVLLGITGSIAAYKGADLVRRLREEGAEVEVVLTDSGAEFITPLTLQALSGRPVHTRLLDPAAESAMGHIALARWADAIVIAPASANVIARLAAGLADDLLTTLCLAADAPLALAPAMNRLMWAHPATRENVARLEARGVRVFGPAEGDQACGEVGPGRMLEPEAIVERIAGLFSAGRLQGRAVLLTAGPTQEAIDPIRFISNRSSGKMGYALANAAALEGARVVLVSGPVERPLVSGVRRVCVRSAADMQAAVAAEAAGCDIFIAAAAVADYRPVRAAPAKLKKREATAALELERTPDILAEVAARPGAPFTVGFAAETGEVEANAIDKLRAKRLDMVVANQVGGDTGFDSDDNEVTVLWPGGRLHLPRQPKERLARRLIETIAERFDAARSAQGS
jgi:phosphopantothenoylcysteine decarboxylase/phosphopantothenate--cysteine ligase